MRILLLEDNPGDARLFRELLADAAVPTAEPVHARSLAQACAVLTEQVFDVACLDLGLPDSGGRHSVEEVRRLAPTLAIVALTGRADEQVALEVLQHGAQDYLHKDFLSAERLAQTLRFAIHRKQVEDSLQERETALHQHQKLTAIGHLAAGIAHEMNTPLQFVGDNLFFVQESLAKLTALLTEVQELVADQAAPPTNALQRLRDAARDAEVPYLLAELPDAVEQCRGGVRHVARIVRAVKEYCHPGHGQRQRVPLGPLVDRILAVTRHVWKDVADVGVELPDDLPEVWCYAEDLGQVLLNLLVNAAQAIAARLGSEPGSKGHITIRAQARDDGFAIAIADTGTGMSARVRERIFQPFFTTKPIGQGTGQGLYMAYNIIVEKHRGAIEVDSEEGVGSTFTLRLPVSEEPPVAAGGVR